MTLEELEAYLEEKGLKDKWKRNGKYWASRFELLEDSMNNKCNDYFYDLERIYTKAISETEKDILKWYNRFAKNEKITLVEAKQTLNKNELKEFRMTLREYIEKGESLDPRWLNELERASIKVHVSRLEALKLQMQQQVESLMGNELDSVDKLLRDIYTKSYYHTAFEIQKGIGVGWDLMKLDTNAINKVMSKPWTADGINFSERIWGKYRPELIKKLHDGLTINIIRGESSDKLINDITKAFEVKKSQTKNLVRTEKAFFMTTSQCDCFNDLGIKEYEIVATLDNKTSEICRAMDGKVFDMKDFQAGTTAPPFHNQCRSTTAPYFNDEFTIDELRAARDEEGKYYTVPSNMKYPEWYKAFVEGDKPKTENEKRKKRENVNSVNWDYVKSVDYKNKFYKITDNRELNELLYKKAIDILEHRNNSNYEDMYLFNSITGELVATQRHSEVVSRVSYNEEIKRAIKNTRENVLISMHNHPISMPPSGGDFSSQIINGYRNGIIICHDGSVYIYKKGNKKFDYLMYEMMIAKYVKYPYNMSEREAQLKVLDILKELGEIDYWEVK